MSSGRPLQEIRPTRRPDGLLLGQALSPSSPLLFLARRSEQSELRLGQLDASAECHFADGGVVAGSGHAMSESATEAERS